MTRSGCERVAGGGHSRKTYTVEVAERGLWVHSISSILCLFFLHSIFFSGGFRLSSSMVILNCLKAAIGAWPSKDMGLTDDGACGHQLAG